MNINKNNTAIIFGCSPFINKISENNINYLIDNYYHIGINNFVQKYTKTKNILFSDYDIYGFIKEYIQDKNIIISKIAYDFNFTKENREKPKNIEFIFDISSEIFHDLSLNKLCLYKTSAHPAVNYLYLKGYKNIILCGIDLTHNWNHFYSNVYSGNDIMRTPNRINKMRSILYQFKDFVNLYQLNPKSDLEIDKITMENL